ncbi:hypothetical protein HZ326_3201 [Fusarium oxysporum f. sp. albedinis]|nr:hypothetical protein HZ326_3201 [Fusarium oxysporum f. sp. albedinis]
MVAESDNIQPYNHMRVRIVHTCIWLACRVNIGSQESFIQMRQSKCLSTNSSSHFGKGGFLTYMCNTLAGLKSTYRMHLGSTPSPSGHVFSTYIFLYNHACHYLYEHT